MAKFRKKPVVIEAWRFRALPFEGDWPDVICVGGGACHRATSFPCTEPHIHTLEGEHRISSGDWIVRGVKGEFYPVKPDIFAATYEAA